LVKMDMGQKYLWGAIGTHSHLDSMRDLVILDLNLFGVSLSRVVHIVNEILHGEGRNDWRSSTHGSAVVGYGMLLISK
jgi:hypothetical protein